MISFKVADESKIPTIINRLEVITFAESLGGVESLITYPRTQTHADIPEDVRLSYGLTNDLLRLSIGIEDVDDLRVFKPRINKYESKGDRVEPVVFKL